MKDIAREIARIGIVPVVKLNRPERVAAPLAKALYTGGIPVAEVTFRAAGAEKAIARMREACPILVGAGTVTNVAQIDAAIAAGGQFIVTPGFDAELVQYAQEREIPVFPGCTTATDYQAALKHGLDMIKFFPAEQCGGLAKIKALAGPFPMFKVMPTGGISLRNLGAYLSCPLVATCGGSYMASTDLIENQKWDSIISLCRESVAIVEEARGLRSET